MQLNRFWMWCGVILSATVLIACEPANKVTPESASSLMVPQDKAADTDPVAMLQPLVVDRYVSFYGEIHCDVCIEKMMTVTLRPDYRYLLKVESADPSVETAFQLGYWQQMMESGRQTIKLLATPYQFAVSSSHQLHLIAPASLTSDDPQNHSVLAQSNEHLHSKPLPIFAVYRYMADAAMMLECGSALRLPVLQQGDSLALEQAYLAAVETPGQPLVVALQASIVATPGEEGGDERWLVESFEAISALNSCEAKLAEPGVTHTYWKLLSIDGQQILTPENRREIHLVLGADGRAHGFAGCNRFFAQYELSGEQLQIDAIGGTKMACPDEMAAEKAFLAALGVIDSFKIEGQKLILLQNGSPLMQLEAVYLY
ncbi:META domain-containing protein [Corallincola luteus]|uniref:META domain-containing protein n=1 Tax=Corallincola luteus TaxID=1775177 RepID=A0ABY2AHC0_9GAMM|nr:META domain-containing protein [Corallincola luteus]TCI01334.1 META domain-containing protein [Corallincola luteus]